MTPVEQLVDHPIGRTIYDSNSITAEMSNQPHHYGQRGDEHGDENEHPISEQPNEDEHSPAGSIGRPHEVMSEPADTNFNKLQKGKPLSTLFDNGNSGGRCSAH